MNREMVKSLPEMSSGPDSIDDENDSIGRIYTSELQQDPLIIKKKVDAKINAILDRYGFTYALTEFSWVNGQVQANLDLVEKPKEETQA